MLIISHLLLAIVDLYYTRSKEKLNEKALLVLNSMKEDKSKLDKLKYNSVQMQGYLSDSNMSTRHKKLVFQARTHMLKTASNFGDKTTSCPLGCDSLDNQEHLVACDVVKMNNYDVMTDTEYYYEDLFGDNVDKIKRAVDLLDKAVRTREILLK